jgi:DNA-directed RNA polymerase specialized sigma24 family protein
MSAPRRRGDDRHMDRISLVYSAAFAASGERAVAEHVTERVFLAAPSGDGEALAERAVLLALRSAPDPAFAAMPSDERDVVGLTRLTGAPAGRVASVLGITPEEVRARMRRGLRALLSAGAVPRRPPLPLGCGSAASPGHAGRAS